MTTQEFQIEAYGPDGRWARCTVKADVADGKVIKVLFDGRPEADQVVQLDLIDRMQTVADSVIHALPVSMLVSGGAA
jgi:hypothetical protein